MSKLTVGDIREPVIRLALVQEEKLRKHDKERGERGWIRDRPMSLLERIYDELMELTVKLGKVVDSKGNIRDDVTPDEICAAQTECADVANFAMMVHDIIFRDEVSDKLSETKIAVDTGTGFVEDPTDDTVEELKDVEHSDVEIPVGMDEIPAIQAKKIAAEIYAGAETDDDRAFTDCKSRALMFYGWELDTEIACWKNGKRRLSIESVGDLRPQDAEFGEMFIDKKVMDMAMGAWNHLQSLIEEENRA